MHFLTSFQSSLQEKPEVICTNASLVNPHRWCMSAHRVSE
ncbi:hypothetical protein ACHAWC_003407 [Mediolabrus comicus]